MSEIKEGEIYAFPYPFIRSTYPAFDGEGYYDQDCFAPGVRYEAVYPDDSQAVADGIGQQIITVVSIHKPGKYPERVFYVRQFKGPDGSVFGKTNLRMKTVTAFRRLVTGYAYDYKMSDNKSQLK